VCGKALLEGRADPNALRNWAQQRCNLAAASGNAEAVTALLDAQTGHVNAKETDVGSNSAHFRGQPLIACDVIRGCCSSAVWPSVPSGRRSSGALRHRAPRLRKTTPNDVSPISGCRRPCADLIPLGFFCVHVGVRASNAVTASALPDAAARGSAVAPVFRQRVWVGPAFSISFTTPALPLRATRCATACTGQCAVGFDLALGPEQPPQRHITVGLSAQCQRSVMPSPLPLFTSTC